jgi:hypothetical protein
MGADLYLDSLYRPQQARYEPLFRHWVQVRDAATDAKAKRRAQGLVCRYYAQLYRRGYFRDSYNASNLLALFELDWWRDIGDQLTADDELLPDQAAALLATLQAREPRFRRNLVQLELEPGESRRTVVRYFCRKYRTLCAFLDEAIRRQEPISCSV